MPDWSFLITAGFMLIILGFFLVAFGIMHSAKEGGKGQETGEAKVKGGGVILIGPVPVVFGTDKRYAMILMILATVLMLLAIVFLKWHGYINK
jgi:uncharacterized protein (TIGR00304 family)